MEFSSPTVVDGTVYHGFDHSDALYAVDAETGEEGWAFTDSSGEIRSTTTAGGIVYVGSWDGGSADGSLYAVDAGVDGSSEDSRVVLGTLGHHDETVAN